MSKALAIPASQELDSLASEIWAEHEACEGDARSAVEHAKKAGKLLIEAKAQVEHGEWLPWLEENFPASRQTAADYMRLSAKCSEDTTFAPPSIDAALAELAEPKLDAPGVSRDESLTVETADTHRVSEGRGRQEPTAGEPELVEAEVVDEPGLPSGMERVDHTTLRALVNNLFAQSRTIERMLDGGFTVEINPNTDDLSADIERVFEVARRLEEAIL